MKFKFIFAKFLICHKQFRVRQPQLGIVSIPCAQLIGDAVVQEDLMNETIDEALADEGQLALLQLVDYVA